MATTAQTCCSSSRSNAAAAACIADIHLQQQEIGETMSGMQGKATEGWLVSIVGTMN